VKWRTGCEGRISTLKRATGRDRTRIDGTEGAGSGPDTRCWPTTWSGSPPSRPRYRRSAHPADLAANRLVQGGEAGTPGEQTRADGSCAAV